MRGKRLVAAAVAVAPVAVAGAVATTVGEAVAAVVAEAVAATVGEAVAAKAAEAVAATVRGAVVLAVTVGEAVTVAAMVAKAAAAMWQRWWPALCHDTNTACGRVCVGVCAQDLGDRGAPPRCTRRRATCWQIPFQ
ncbi:hypothetical protein I4F81_002310 [Pyropia yezoensis]|uniref:Uncharacterized protein n=1 Tax=Pyropia yezoensis TaxID=2788 RepID=A0ACC3BQR0_PYRYE|nr:hypothetical protein I4F81_002310 [Neopyropia yezoensis]